MASVFRRHGRWIISAKLPNGTWRQHRTTACTKTEANALAHELERKYERQRLGLDPIPSECSMTLSELCRWWLANRCPAASVKRETSRLNAEIVMRPSDGKAWPVGELRLPEVTSEVLEEHLRELERAGLGPNSANRLRAILRVAFEKARKAKIWIGGNPVDDVERRRVPKRVYDTLSAEEALRMLAHVPGRWTDLFAAALWTGMRKGELLALPKDCVDLSRRTIRVEHSNERDTTKGAHGDVIPIAEPLYPRLLRAIAAAPGELVFPGPKGKLRKGSSTKLELVLRRALSRAGIVVGYVHSCRRCKRRGAPHEERQADCELRRCPVCGMKLWCKPLPRPVRFHDLRHTTATLLLSGGVPAQHVQRILRHADIRTTTTTYNHMVVEDLRGAIEQITASAMPALTAAALGAPMMLGEAPRPATLPGEAVNAAASLSLEERARRESNPRPTDSKGESGPIPASSIFPVASLSAPLAATAEQAVPLPSTQMTESFCAPLVRLVSQTPDQLLDAGEVAKLLGVCRDTVYRLCERGELPHVRIGSLLRFDRSEIAALLERSRRR